MSGVFSKEARPALAGAYTNWESEPEVQLEPSSGSVCAVAASADWGPVNEIVQCDTFPAFTAIFGSNDSPLRRAVWGLFKGEGRPGKGGAGRVLVYRAAAPAAAAATFVLQNTTPAPALTFTARFKGTNGNSFRFTTQASLTPGKTEILILKGSLLLETFTVNTTFTAPEAAALAAEINASSNWFTVVVGTSGVALATVSAQPATGGLDGSTLTGTEYAAVMAAFDAKRWAVFAAYNVTDPTIRASILAWQAQRNLRGRRHFTVIGGAAAESATTANARSVATNDPNVVNVGVGTITLTDLGVAASPAEFTARVAGAIAARGETKDLMYARFADVSISTVLTPEEEAVALAAGTTFLSQDADEDTPVFIREGVTTYSNDSQSPVDQEGNKLRQVSDYKRIKNLRIQHGIETEVEIWATSGDIIGDLPVNDRTRAIVYGFLTTIYQRREAAEIVQPGWVVEVDGDPPADDDQDFVQYTHGFHPTRTLRQIYNTARIG